MGKGNRSRIERAMAEANNATTPVKAKKNKVSGAGIFVAIAAILVVIALLVGAIGVLNDSGWFARTQTVVETDNYRVTGTMMNYFFMTQFNSYYEYYYQLYSSLSQSSSQYKSVYDLMGIDPNKSLKLQYMDAKEGEEKVTVFDYYMGLTQEYVTQMLTYCEFATKAGIELDAEDRENIDKSLKNIKATFESQMDMYEQYAQFGIVAPYSTYSAYLAANYGTGVKERDIRSALELVTLAAKFEEKITDEKEELLLSDEDRVAIEKYVEENPSKFLMADYYSYSFQVVSKDYENEKAFEDAKNDILAKAKKFKELEGKEAFKAALKEQILNDQKESYREKNWSTYLDKHKTEEAAEEAMQKYFTDTYTDKYLEDELAKRLVEGYPYPSTATDLSKWVFGYDPGEHTDECDHEGEHEKAQDPAKEGDITYIENTSKKEEPVKKEETTTAPTTTAPETTEGAAEASEETTKEDATTKEEATTKAPSATTTETVEVTTYTVTVYMLEKESYRNTEITKHFGYVMFSEKEDAEAFYAEYSKGEMNKDTLIEVLEEMYEADNTLSLYAYDAVEDYLPGDLKDQKVDGADEWLEKATAGQNSGVVELVMTTNSSSSSSSGSTTKKTTYYSVLVYDKDGYEYWFCDALEGATAKAVKDWYEENGLKLDYNTKAYKFIDM